MNTPTPTPSKDEVNLDNLPLKDALRFVDENSTTGGLFTKAALKTLAAKCRELTAVTEQRDRLAEALKYQKELNEWIENTNPEDPFFDEGLRLGLNHASDLATEALAAVKGGSDDFDQFRPFDF